MVSRPETPDGEQLLGNTGPLTSDQDQHSKPQHSHRPPPLLWQIFWWLLTLSISALILIVIKIYETQGNFTSVQKHTFNAISTALILGLGLNFFGSHHTYALNDMP